MRIAALALVLAVAGCGAEKAAKVSGPPEERGVREALDGYAAAVRSGSAEAVCAKFVARELLDRFAALGADCARDFFGSAVADGGPQYKVVVGGVRIDGERALASGYEVTRKGRHDERFPLVREDDGKWRVTLTPPAADRGTMNAAQRAVRKQVDRYVELMRAGDAKTICAEMVSAEHRKEIAGMNADCVKDFYGAWSKRYGAKYAFRVREIKVVGDRAEASGAVSGDRGADELDFIHEPDGAWRLTLTAPG